MYALSNLHSSQILSIKGFRFLTKRCHVKDTFVWLFICNRIREFAIEIVHSFTLTLTIYTYIFGTK